MRPTGLKTKIFLDSGDPNETKETIHLLGFLDGQTTNPSLIAKNPSAQGKKFTKDEIASFYKGVITEINSLIPNGSISIEVYADKNSTVENLCEEGRKMFSWIPNAHIKYPIIKAGLEAAQRSVKEGIRVNMTLCFTEEQAAAVYSATTGAKDAYVSPFAGRLDDKGLNGMDLIKNIIKTYKNGDGHTKVLAASIRNMDHFMCSIAMSADIITAPFKILKEWAEKGLQIPGPDYIYPKGNLQEILYQEIALNKPWQEYNISHEMTDAGLGKFANDWNNLIK